MLLSIFIMNFFNIINSGHNKNKISKYLTIWCNYIILQIIINSETGSVEKNGKPNNSLIMGLDTIHDKCSTIIKQQ